MMKSLNVKLMLAFTLLLSAAGNLYADNTGPSPEEIQAMENDCNEWAKYDEIEGEEELKSYIESCVNELIREYKLEPNEEEELTEHSGSLE